MNRLERTVSVVTGGGAAGIGAACVQRLSDEGAHVVTFDMGDGVDYVLDVRDEEAVTSAFQSTMVAHGRIDAVRTYLGHTDDQFGF
jgi:NADP-dependent 3-hydroxy acid dehydrogenase YdfG